MALIDVSDLLLDPDFVSSMSLVHRVPTINQYGENILSSTTVATIGVAEPTSGRDLIRLPDDLQTQDVYTFWIKGEIISDATNEYPDLILFNGQNYEIQKVLDWGNFKPGWCQALAVRQVPSL